MSEEMNRRKGQYIKGVALIKRSLDYARDDRVGRGTLGMTMEGEECSAPWWGRIPHCSIEQKLDF
jgi:hypothetical protein